MKIPFTKLQGARNDFLVTPAGDVPITDLQELAIAICNRYTGVGGDGWMILDRTEGVDAQGQSYEATIRLFNSDGSEPEISGNGTRCAALLLARDLDRDNADDVIRIRTGAGIKHLRIVSRNHDREFLLEMNMGEIRVLESHAIVQGHQAVILDAGNPQCAIPVSSFDFDWRAAGAAIERDPRFPNRTNVSFFKRVDKHTLDVRFWERGAGETNSSGTGSSGAAQAAVSRGLVESPINVLTIAGPLKISVGCNILLTGPAEYIADGTYFYGKIISQ